MTRERAISAAAAFAASAVFAALGSDCAGAEPIDINALRRAEAALSGLIERVEPAVVAVLIEPAAAGGDDDSEALDGFFQDLAAEQAAGERSRLAGTGVLIDRSGLVLTMYVAVQPGARHFVGSVDGSVTPAKLLAADPRSGLAILQITENASSMPVLELGRAEELRKGSQIVAIGNPEAILNGGQPTASVGSVTNFSIKPSCQVNLNNTPDRGRRSFRTTLHHYGTLIQTDARLGWSWPGGALIDLSGRLVGIMTPVSAAVGHEEPARYAIPMNESMRRVVRALKQGKEVEYGLLGISFPVEAAVSRRRRAGIEVQYAFPGGPAARAGMRQGDVITHVADVAVVSTDGLQLEVGRRAPGVATRVRFLRDGVQREAMVRLAKQHPMAGGVVTALPRSWHGLTIDYATALPQKELDAASRRGLIASDGCVVVRTVERGSNAWAAGARPGKFITHVGNRRVRSPPEFWRVADAGGSLELRFTKPKPQATSR